MDKNIYKDVKGQSESALQQKIVFWFWNTYPEFRGLLCYNLNNSVGGRRAKVNQSLGIVKGRSDMVLYIEGKAIMIELKTEKGYQSPTQKKWEVLIASQGFEYYIIRSLEEFKNLIKVIFQEEQFL